MEFPWFAKVLKVAKRWQEAVEIFALAQNRQLGRHVGSHERRVTNPRRVVDDGGFDSVPIYIYICIYDVCVCVRANILYFDQPNVEISAIKSWDSSNDNGDIFT